jgi:DNA-binding protein WhiA
MAMTARVKDELSRLTVMKPCCRKAEVATTLRFAGGLHIVGGRIVVEAELDTAAAARRLRKELSDVYGHNSEVTVLSAGGLRRGSRYVVGVVQDGEALARQTGLIDARGRPVRGLPPSLAGPQPWRSPAPAPRRRSRWSVRQGGWVFRPRLARSAAWTASSCATATRSARC